jgi:hypothetical protein
MEDEGEGGRGVGHPSLRVPAQVSASFVAVEEEGGREEGRGGEKREVGSHRKERGRKVGKEGGREGRKQHAPGAHGRSPLFGEHAPDNGDTDSALFDEGTSFQHTGGAVAHSPVAGPFVDLEGGACAVFVLGDFWEEEEEEEEEEEDREGKWRIRWVSGGNEEWMDVSLLRREKSSPSSVLVLRHAHPSTSPLSTHPSLVQSSSHLTRARRIHFVSLHLLILQSTPPAHAPSLVTTVRAPPLSLATTYLKGADDVLLRQFEKLGKF